MAAGVREAAAVDGEAADVGIATTGVAGPTPQDGRAVGTVHIAVATPDGIRGASLALAGTRTQIRAEATAAALALALACIPPATS